MSLEPRRVGLLGGTFDPVHNAHLALAHAALAELRLHSVRWIPTGQPWQKDRPITSAEHREAMVRLATAEEPRFEVDRLEIERQGPTYTVDTVKALSAAEPGCQWFLIIGQDQYAGLHTWQGWQELVELVVLAVANRPGDVRTVSTDVVRQRHRSVPLPMLDISASEIRRRVMAHQDISALVPPAVAQYIESNGLYRGPR
jgi:nicotinate-nucleotide adenylyltransferase